jgi:hypothetical protein
MCFSAPASFAVATGTALVGALVLTKVTSWRELPLAAVPLLFASQQAIEGLLWLLLGRGGSTIMVGLLAESFAFVALVVWPAWTPLAVGLVERNRVRQLALIALFALSIPISYVGWRYVSAHAVGVCIVGHSLSYANGTNYSPPELGGYLLCTCCPLFLSSHRLLRYLGMLVVTGLAISAYFFLVTSFSVWCFFAAASSVLICFYFVPVAAPARQIP